MEEDSGEKVRKAKKERRKDKDKDKEKEKEKDKDGGAGGGDAGDKLTPQLGSRGSSSTRREEARANREKRAKENVGHTNNREEGTAKVECDDESSGAASAAVRESQRIRTKQRKNAEKGKEREKSGTDLSTSTTHVVPQSGSSSSSSSSATPAIPHLSLSSLHCHPPPASAPLNVPLSSAFPSRESSAGPPTPLCSPTSPTSPTSSSSSSSLSPPSSSSSSSQQFAASGGSHGTTHWLRRNKEMMLVKWRTSIRTFLSEVEDEDGVEAEQTNEDISNRVRIYKRASADYEAQRVDRWSCRLCSIINEAPRNTCQVCGRRRRSSTARMIEDDDDDDDAPRRNTLTSGCPVAKIAEEILLHIFSYLDIRELSAAACVCRKWRTLTDDHCLWNTLIVSHASRLLGLWEAKRILEGEEEEEVEEGGEEVLYYHINGGRFKAASLDRLLDMITSGDDLDLNEQKAFLATYPSFTTSDVLLAKIIGLYNRVARRAERHEEERSKGKSGDEEAPEAARRPVTLCLGSMSLKTSTRHLIQEGGMDGEGDSDGSSSGEHQLPSTPRKRGQTINTPRDKPENSVWRTAKAESDTYSKDKAALYASGGALPARKKPSASAIFVGESRGVKEQPRAILIPPPPPPPPPPPAVTVVHKTQRIKNIIVKPAKQLVSPLASSAVTLGPSPTTTTVSAAPPQPNEQPDIDADTFAKQARICSVLKKWVEANYEELPRGVVDLLLAFVRGRLLRQRQPAYAPMAHSLVMSITRRARLLRGEELGHANIFPQLPPEPEVPRNICSPTLSLWDVPALEIARQLTLIEFERFKAIRASELFGQAWSSARNRHKAPHVVEMIIAFNDFCMWVSTTLLSYERIKDRVKCMETFASIAKHLYNLKNFNTLMALLAGIRSGPVYRLAYTRAEVSRKADKTLEHLNLLMRGDNAYKTYRYSTTIATAAALADDSALTSNSASDVLSQSAPPCIPYLGVHLSDLTFIEDGNPDTIRGLINFTKRRFLFRVISEISRYQQNAYNLHPVPQIQSLLTNFTMKKDDELYDLSLQREPRDAERKDIL